MSVATQPVAQAAAAHMSLFYRELHRDLYGQLGPEMELTMRVAILHAGGFNRSEITKKLQVEDLEVKMALRRLERIARAWDD